MLPDPLTTPCTPIPLVAISAWGRGDQEQQQRLKSPVEVQPTIVKPKNELVVKLPRADLPTPAISSFVLSCFVAFNDGINILNPSGHYMYRTVVTICTAQWSLYVPHSGHCMYRQFNIQQFHVLPTQCIYVFCVDLRTNSHYFPIQH